MVVRVGASGASSRRVVVGDVGEVGEVSEVDSGEVDEDEDEECTDRCMCAPLPPMNHRRCE